MKLTRKVLLVILVTFLLTAISVAVAESNSSSTAAAAQRIATLGGTVLGRDKKDFTLVYTKAGADVTANAMRLAEELSNVDHPDKLVLVVGSEDTATISKIAVGAFDKIKPGRLAGYLIVFVGAAGDAKSVGDAVVKSGAKFLFVEFTP